MNDGSKLLEKHVKVPVYKIWSVIVSLLQPEPDFIFSLFFHVEGHFEGPTLYDLAEIISVLKLEKFEIDQFFDGSNDFIFIMNEVEQIFS